MTLTVEKADLMDMSKIKDLFVKTSRRTLCVLVSVCVCVCEREREREREKDDLTPYVSKDGEI